MGSEATIATVFTGEVIQYQSSARLEEVMRWGLEAPVRAAVIRGSELHVLCADGIRTYGRHGGNLIQTEEFAPKTATGFVVSKDRFYVCGRDGEIMCVDSAAKRSLLLEPPLPFPVNRITKSKTLLAVAGGEPVVRLFKADVPPILAAQIQSTDMTPVKGLSWNALGDTLGIATSTRVEMIDAETMSVKTQFETPPEMREGGDLGWRQLAWKSDLCVEATRTHIRVFDLLSPTPVRSLKTRFTNISALATRETRITVGTLDGDIVVYDIRNPSQKLYVTKSGKIDIRKALVS
jgi:hypothetical protein